MSNKFITLLDKLGSLFKVGVQKAIAIEANPAVQTLEQVAAAGLTIVDPPAGALVTDILGKLIKVEQICVAVKASAGTGEQKLQLVIPEVTALIFDEPLFKGKTPEDMSLFNSGISEITDGFAKILNSFASPVAPTT